MRTITKNWANRLRMAGVACIIAMGSAVTAHAQATIGLYEVARFNLNSTSGTGNAEFIGSNPYSVAWNGSKLYVAGVNNSGATGTTAIVEVTNAGSTVTAALAAGSGGLATPSYSSAFGKLSTGASSLGYRGLSLSTGLLAAAWDNNTNSANSYQLFNTGSNTLNWNMSVSAINIRGWAVAFDPGYQGDPTQGGGFAFVNAGSGRRQLNAVTTGSNIYNSTNGFLINNSASQATWRDMAFDPATGDVYMKASNLVTKTVRNGANLSYANPAAPETAILVNQTVSTAIGSTLGFMSAITSSTVGSFSNAYSGNLVAYNNTATPLATNFTNAVKFVNTSGTAVSASWTFISGSMPTSSSSIYDFSWDPTSQTLAVLDYTNRNVSIFSTAVPEPSTTAIAGMCTVGLASLMLRGRRRSENNS